MFPKVAKRSLNAAISLGEIGDSRAVKPLIKALADLGYRGYRIDYSARDALCNIGKPAVDSLIIALGCDPHDNVRMHAAKCLGKICDNSAVEPLINALLCDKWHSVRQFAAEALGNIGDMRAFIPLKKAVSDRDSLVHDWAEWALNKLRPF
jgi:HEAT repeat protein